MTNALDHVYLSAVLLARALESAGHPKALEAMVLKDAIAKAVTHPDSVAEESFSKAWAQRGQFEGLGLEGDTGAAVAKHAALLAQAELSF
jgi:hypothetical protein